MTKRQLRQIYYIDREIKMWERELERIRQQSEVGSNVIDGMPRGGVKRDIADTAAEAADIETIIAGLLKKLQLERSYAIRYINTIDDSLVRQIIYLRNVCLMSWESVANEIGGGNSSDSVRKIYDRFLNNQGGNYKNVLGSN